MKKLDIIVALAELKKAVIKEDEIKDKLYELDIDIMNMENKSTAILMNLLTIELDCLSDDIEWWLYEKVEKEYSFGDGRPSINIESAADFVNYYWSLKNGK
jgi:hypothetical protein